MRVQLSALRHRSAIHGLPSAIAHAACRSSGGPRAVVAVTPDASKHGLEYSVDDQPNSGRLCPGLCAVILAQYWRPRRRSPARVQCQADRLNAGESSKLPREVLATMLERARRQGEDLERAAAHRLSGSPSVDFLRRLSGQVPSNFIRIGEASHGTHEFYRIRGEITKRLIREHGFAAITARKTRFTRMPIGSTDMYGDAGAIETRARRWHGLTAFRMGCGETRTCSTSLAGFVSTTIASPPPSASGSTVSISTACTRLWMPCSATFRLVDPDAAARARARYACFDRFGVRSAELWLRGLTRTERDLRAPEVVCQLVELRRAVRGVCESRRTARGGRSLLCAARDAQVVRDAGAVLSRHVWEPRGFVELARPAHEREPPVTAGSFWAGNARAPRSSYGRTDPHAWERRSRDGEWAPTVSSTSGSWYGSATGGMRWPWASPRMAEPSRRPQTGAESRAAESGSPSPGVRVTRRCSTAWEWAMS